MSTFRDLEVKLGMEIFPSPWFLSYLRGRDAEEVRTQLIDVCVKANIEEDLPQAVQDVFAKCEKSNEIARRLQLAPPYSDDDIDKVMGMLDAPLPPEPKQSAAKPIEIDNKARYPNTKWETAPSQIGTAGTDTLWLLGYDDGEGAIVARTEDANPTTVHAFPLYSLLNQSQDPVTLTADIKPMA